MEIQDFRCDCPTGDDPDPDLGDNVTTESTTVGDARTTASPTMTSTLVYIDTQGHSTTVYVLPGAVNEPITLLHTALSTPTHPISPNLRFAGHAFTLEAYQGGERQPGLGFSKPVTATIHYSDADVAGMDENSLTLDYRDGSRWVDAATTCTPHLSPDPLSCPPLPFGRKAGVGGEGGKESGSHDSPDGESWLPVGITGTSSRTLTFPRPDGGYPPRRRSRRRWGQVAAGCVLLEGRTEVLPGKPVVGVPGRVIGDARPKQQGVGNGASLAEQPAQGIAEAGHHLAPFQVVIQRQVANLRAGAVLCHRPGGGVDQPDQACAGGQVIPYLLLDLLGAFGGGDDLDHQVRCDRPEAGLLSGRWDLPLAQIHYRTLFSNG